MALRKAGEHHYDNAGGSRKLSAVAAGHTMGVKERHYEKVGEDFEQVHESYRRFHPAFSRIGNPSRLMTMKHLFGSNTARVIALDSALLRFEASAGCMRLSISYWLFWSLSIGRR
jgi:hypothetical protein